MQEHIIMREETRKKREEFKKIDSERLKQKRLKWKEENNRLLKYGIAVAHDKCFNSPAKTRLMILFNLERTLKQRGAKWQLGILRIHIKKWLKSHFDSERLLKEVRGELNTAKQTESEILSHPE